MNTLIKKIETKIPNLLLIIALFIQFVFWLCFTSKIKYDFTITPLPPSKIEMGVFSFGDNELLYRIYAFKLQNAGDTFGETTPLKNYDYEKLEKWFYALNDLDNISEYVPSIAGFYFSSSQNPLDNKYIIDYLLDFANRDPEKYWRWLATSAYIAKHKLKNEELAFSIARSMLNLKNNDIPFINRAMALFMLNERDLKTCKVVKMVKELIESGELELILKDKIFSSKDTNNNMLFKLVKYRIDAVIKNKQLLNKCLRSN